MEAFRRFRLALRAGLVGCAVVLLESCGSGAVSGPPTPPGPVVVTPSTATLYSELPTSFIVSGGTGTYSVSSNNQAVIPLSTSFTANELVVTPNDVGADTPVVLTFTSGTAAPTTVSLTVKSRTISNVLTITPSSTQSAACGTGLCAGGDAEVKAVLSLNGLPLSARQVRFDVVSGDIRIISSTPSGEILLPTVVTATDTSGTARVRIRALNDAPAQTAIIQMTDLGSGFVQTGSVSIAAGAKSPLSAQPATLKFQGTVPGKCSSNVSADVIVSGGRPPYQISQPSDFAISPITLSTSPGRFTVTTTGQCSSGATIAIVDAAGATVTITASNALADASLSTTFTVSPSTVSLGTCTDSATVVLIGGSGTYVAASGNAAVSASVNQSSSGSFGVIRRAAGSSPGTASVTVSFSDGRTTKDVTVALSGAAAASCPTSPTPIIALAAAPTSVNLTSCSDIANFSVTGGSGTYSALPSSSALTVGGSSGFYSVRRAPSNTTITSPQFVTVSDGSQTVSVQINVSGNASGTCTTSTSNALTVFPTSVTLSECTNTPTVLISGGTGTYTAAASNTGITTSISSNLLTIGRKSSSVAFSVPSPCPNGGSGNQCVTITDGASAAYVNVTASGAGAGACP